MNGSCIHIKIYIEKGNLTIMSRRRKIASQISRPHLLILALAILLILLILGVRVLGIV